jgi:hypothetical protein
MPYFAYVKFRIVGVRASPTRAGFLNGRARSRASRIAGRIRAVAVGGGK